MTMNFDFRNDPAKKCIAKVNGYYVPLERHRGHASLTTTGQLVLSVVVLLTAAVVFAVGA